MSNDGAKTPTDPMLDEATLLLQVATEAIGRDLSSEEGKAFIERVRAVVGGLAATVRDLYAANQTFIGEVWKTERELIHAANRERDEAKRAVSRLHELVAAGGHFHTDARDEIACTRRQVDKLIDLAAGAERERARADALKRWLGELSARVDGLPRYDGSPLQRGRTEDGRWLDRAEVLALVRRPREGGNG